MAVICSGLVSPTQHDSKAQTLTLMWWNVITEVMRSVCDSLFPSILLPCHSSLCVLYTPALLILDHTAQICQHSSAVIMYPENETWFSV